MAAQGRVPKMHAVAHRLSLSLVFSQGFRGFVPMMEARLGGAEMDRISRSPTAPPPRHSLD